MTTSHKAECYESLMALAHALGHFKLDITPTDPLELTLPVTHIKGLYIQAVYRPPSYPEVNKYTWLVTVYHEAVRGIGAGQDFNSARELASTNFLGQIVKQQSMERVERAFQRIQTSGLAKSGDWISVCADGRVRICPSYEKAAELDGHQPGWCCRQYIAVAEKI